MKIINFIDKYSGYLLGVFCILLGTQTYWEGLWNKNSFSRIFGFIATWVGFFMVLLWRRISLMRVKEAED